MNDINLFANRLKKIQKYLDYFTDCVEKLRDFWLRIDEETKNCFCDEDFEVIWRDLSGVEKLRDIWLWIAEEIRICFCDEDFDGYWCALVSILSDTIFTDLDDILLRQMKDYKESFRSILDYLKRIKAVLGHDSALADAAAEQEDCDDENKKAPINGARSKYVR